MATAAPSWLSPEAMAGALAGRAAPSTAQGMPIVPPTPAPVFDPFGNTGPKDQSRMPQGALQPNTQVAGDIKPLPITQGLQIVAGPTGQSFDAMNYALGNKTDPRVESIGRQTIIDFLERAGKRTR